MIMEDGVERIKPLKEADFDSFFKYLNQQLSQNGKDGSPLFQPLSRSISGFPKEKETSFIDGLTFLIGQPKWRRAWIMTESSGEIIGHMDLRALLEPYTEHRTLLGMGMLKKYQRKGYGELLVNYAINWVKADDVLEQIDLSVLSNNIPAIRLYEKVGFNKVCEISDMFRIDGNSESHIMMTKNVSAG